MGDGSCNTIVPGWNPGPSVVHVHNIDLGFFCFWFCPCSEGFSLGPLVNKGSLCYNYNCVFVFSTSNCFSNENETWPKTFINLLMYVFV